MSRIVPIVCGLLLSSVSLKPAHAADPLDVIQKVIEANGGKDKLMKHKAVVLKGSGTIVAQGMKLKYDGAWWFHYPNKIRTELESRVMDMPVKLVQVYTGKEGWTKVAGMLVKLNESQLQALATQMKVDTAASFVPLLDKKKYTVSNLGTVKVNKKPAIGLNITGKNGLDVNFYFDPQSWLLIKQEYQSKNETGKDVTQEVYMSKYQKVKGVPVPWKVEFRHDGKPFISAEFSEVELKQKLDVKLFEKPKK